MQRIGQQFSAFFCNVVGKSIALCASLLFIGCFNPHSYQGASFGILREKRRIFLKMPWKSVKHQKSQRRRQSRRWRGNPPSSARPRVKAAAA